MAESGLRIVDGVALVVLDRPPVNALSIEVRRAAVDAIEEAVREASVQAIVISGAGRGFSGGADITEFGRPPLSPGLAEVIERVERSPKPVVAALHGVALGGGLELALACHARVAAPDARLGLPEVKLGLLPGAGGTQRLPRLVGVEVALGMIVTGEPVTAARALEFGLVDAVIEDGDLVEGAARFARGIAGGAAPVPARDREDRIAAARSDPDLFERFRSAHARLFRTGVEAPGRCVEAVRAAVSLPFEEGLATERRLFVEAMGSGESLALRHLFLAERKAGKLAGGAGQARDVRRVGVIGAGTMGGGIAMNFASAGIPTVVVEAQEEALARGLATIRRNYEATAKKGRLSADEVAARTGRIEGALGFEALSDCDLIVEAVFEDMAVKKEVFARLDQVAKADAVLATNTSYLDVDEIGRATSRPGSVVGMHFFSPANVMRLVEVVRGRESGADAVATALEVARRVGKIAVPVGVCHGFVGNRMLAARQREANAMALEGIAFDRIDRVMTEFGMPMGPFAMGDLAGLDVGWSRRPSGGTTVREKLCEQGRFGQKTGGGFYDYDAERRATPSPAAFEAIRAVAAQDGIAAREASDAEILDRLTLPMINEGARILEEGIAQRGSDIDVVWVTGYGWPAWRGGPMFHADRLGLAHVVSRLEDMSERLGPEFVLSPLLVRLAGQTGGGSLSGEGG